jgi:hypothetical protein
VKYVSPLLAAELARQVGEGRSPRELGRLYGIHPATIYRYERGQSRGGRRGPRSLLSELQIEVCVHAWTMGDATLRELADAYGIRRPCLLNLLRTRGVVERKAPARSAKHVSNVALALESTPSTDAAAQLKRSA